MFKFVKNSCLILFITALVPSAMLAQGTMPQQQQSEANYSEDELKTFVEATESVQKVQAKHQQEMVAVIQKEGLTPTEFQTMAQQQQQAQQQADAETPEMTEEKKAAFANAMNNVMQIQQKMSTEMESTLAEHDMEMQQYQQMAMNIQQSPELSQKVMKMMEE